MKRWDGRGRSAPPRLGPPEMMLADERNREEKREIEGERVGGGGNLGVKEKEEGKFINKL